MFFSLILLAIWSLSRYQYHSCGDSVKTLQLENQLLALHTYNPIGNWLRERYIIGAEYG